MGYAAYGSMFSSSEVVQTVKFLAGNIVDQTTNCDEEYWQGKGGIGGTTGFYWNQAIAGELGWDGALGPAGTYTSVRERLAAMTGDYLPRDGSLAMTGNLDLDGNVLTNSGTTLVSGLNADLVDSLEASQFLRSDVSDQADGAITIDVTANPAFRVQANSGGTIAFNVDTVNSYVFANTRLGIGTNAPDYALDVVGDIGLDEYLYHNADADTYIRFQTNDISIAAGGNLGINVDSSGQVGIGTDAQASLVDIRGANPTVTLYNSSTGAYTFAFWSSTPALIGWIDMNATTKAMTLGSGAGGGDVEFYCANAKRMWLESSNNGVYFVGPPVPETDGSVACGDTALRWANVWSSLLNVSGVTTLNNVAYTWPGSQASGSVLQTNGSGTLSWATQASMSVGNADTVDSLHAASFLRSDANDTGTGTIALNLANSRAFVVADAIPHDKFVVDTSSGIVTVTGGLVATGTTTFNSIAYTWPASDSALYLKSDGAGTLSWAAAVASGGNADTVDSLHAASFLRSDVADQADGALTINAALDILSTSDWKLASIAYTGGMSDLNTLRDNSMADALHRHSELSASDGTPDASVQVDASGNLGISLHASIGSGAAPASNVALSVTDTISAAGSNMGIISYMTAGSTSDLMRAGDFAVGTSAAAITLTDAVAVNATQLTKGAGSTITNAYGLKVADITIGTNNWSIYTGSAASYFGGTLNISTATNWQLGGVAYTGTMANLNTLRDDSMADALHRHSELSASDGTPNPALQVDVNGNVGVGTAALARLTAYLANVDGDASYVGWFQNADVDNGNGVFIKAGDDSAVYTLRVQDVSANELFAVRGDGNVGIGTAAPNWTLHLQDSGASGGPFFSLENTNADEHPSYILIDKNSASPAVNDNIGCVYFRAKDSATNLDTFASIRTYTLDPTSGSEEGRLSLGVMTAGAWNDAVLNLVGGNVGIGTATPAVLLHLNAANPTQYFVNTSTGSAGLAFYDSPSTLDAWFTVTEATAVMSLGTGVSGGDVEFYVANSKRMWLESSNNGIYCVGPPVPSTDGGVALGDAALHWSGLYANELRIGSASDDVYKVEINGAPNAMELRYDGAAASQPILAFYNGGSPSVPMWFGQIDFWGENSISTKIKYASILGGPFDVANGTEDGIIAFYTYRAGTYLYAGKIHSDGSWFGDGPYVEFDEFDDRTQIELAIKNPLAVHEYIRDMLFEFNDAHCGPGEKSRPLINYSVALTLWAGGIYQNRWAIDELRGRVDGLWEEAHQMRAWQDDYGVKVLDINERLAKLETENAELRAEVEALKAA